MGSQMGEDASWRTPAFRQSVVSKIDEAIRSSGMNTSRNSIEMENHVYQKAKNKEEYLGYVARLILHVREMNSKKGAMGGPGVQGGGGGGMNQGGGGGGGGGPGGGGMPPDPINALQNLASQGTRNQQQQQQLQQQQQQQQQMNMAPQQQGGGGGPMGGPPQQQITATNLLQTLNRGGQVNMNAVMQQQQQQGMQSRPNMGMGPNSGGPMGTNQMVGQMGGGQLPNQIANQLAAAVAAGQMPPIMSVGNHPMQGGGGVGGGGGGGPLINQMVPGQLGNQMSNQLPGQLQMGGPMGVGGPSMSAQMQNQLLSMQQQMQQQQQQQQQQNKVGGVGGPQQPPPPHPSMQQQQQMMNGPPPPNAYGRGGGPVGAPLPPGSVPGGPGGGNATNQFLRQSPSPASVQSPVGLGGGPPSSNANSVVNQMVASPALVPSPSGGGGGMLGPVGPGGGGGPPRSVGGGGGGGMAPSPGGAGLGGGGGSSLNTPAGQPNQSPMSMQEQEQAYREKVRQLSKYIEPLKKMIARMGNDGEHVEKSTKMKKLLEILVNPQQRMPLETLIKCEVVLEKMDFKRTDGSVPSAGLGTPHNMAAAPIKEHHVFNPLIEAVSNNLQSPVINHTLHRTFGPTLEALFGPEIKLVPPLKKAKLEEPSSDIPDVLQGEIARLDQRFKVSLDPNQQPGAKYIQLTCWLDDKQLPCVPPISLTIPEDYPKSVPECNIFKNSESNVAATGGGTAAGATQQPQQQPQQPYHEYQATEFLSNVRAALLARIKKLPKFYSVSQLLDTWEMSVRQASAPASRRHNAATSPSSSSSATSSSVFTTTLLMGL